MAYEVTRPGGVLAAPMLLARGRGGLIPGGGFPRPGLPAGQPSAMILVSSSVRCCVQPSGGAMSAQAATVAAP